MYLPQTFVSKSKSIIDEIDDVFAEYYGLTNDEINFIKNFDVTFRITDIEGGEENPGII